MNLLRWQVLQTAKIMSPAFKSFRASKHSFSPSFKQFSGRKYNLGEITNLFVYGQIESFCRASTVCINKTALKSLNTASLATPHKRCHSTKDRDIVFGLQKRYFTEDRETTALTVWSNLKELKSSPVPALAYGFLGLIPFVSVPVYMTMSQMYLPQIAFAQLTYGAVILSFLGGVRWGFVIPEESKHNPNWFNLGYSVTPSLVAWMGLLLPDPISMFSVMAGLAGAAYFDIAIPGYPPWFKGLRFVLSIVAVLSLWTTFMCRVFLNFPKENAIDENPKKK